MKKSEFKQRIREEAQRRVRGSGRTDAAGERAMHDAVEAGRKQLLVKCNEGGDSAATKIKSELMYLINNYLPKYDSRIEQLIDAWRTSHDPSYDPGIRARFRAARQTQMKKSNPY